MLAVDWGVLCIVLTTNEHEIRMIMRLIIICIYIYIYICIHIHVFSKIERACENLPDRLVHITYMGSSVEIGTIQRRLAYTTSY